MELKETKKTAIIMFKAGTSVFEVAGDLDIPLALAEEWYRELDFTAIDSFRVQSKAVQNLRLCTDIPDPEFKIKARVKIEDMFMTLLDNVQIAMETNDLLLAKKLELCSNVLIKLNTVINDGEKPEEAINIEDTRLLAFQEVLKD